MDYAFPPHADLYAEWRDKALCLNKAGTEDYADNAWIADSSLSRRAEDALCAKCESRQECIIDALLDPDSEGNRGGFYFEQGRLSRSDSHKLWNELRLKSKVRNVAKKFSDEDL